MEPGVLSDVTRFNLSSDDNLVRVWRPRGSRLKPALVLQRYTATAAGVMGKGQDCIHTVITLPCPARFLDLSPIEHIWDHLRQRVGHSTSLNELEARFQQIWNEMSQEIIQNLYVSMPDRIVSCIRARECSIEY
ncbi:transposable element Tcb2 transposase [Trichonephila clavipes]|nr:transposable element Tcb2 transposase [Trichonephila clavipes]